MCLQNDGNNDNRNNNTGFNINCEMDKLIIRSPIHY